MRSWNDEVMIIPCCCGSRAAPNCFQGRLNSRSMGLPVLFGVIAAKTGIQVLQTVAKTGFRLPPE
ncbi:MAG: hypothetical protein CVU57_09470 [Deltaproteobacteria bacterium HGW-Deltaproteobacteria-15]|nr:MAG: hypothetical protein CVU57_09470 [Deltaproteobacteria bacterium HGW-Deltaproteobacteria-15]